MDESLALPFAGLPARTDREWADIAAELAEQGKAELAQYRSLQEIVEAHRRAVMLQAYLKQVIKDQAHKHTAANHIKELQIWQQREIGGWLASIETREVGRPAEIVTQDTISAPSLESLGVSRMQSHRWKVIAKLPEPQLEAHIAEVKAAGRELTSSGVFREARRLDLVPTADTPPFPASTYRCIVIDPPWPGARMVRDNRPLQPATLDYDSMEIEELKALPIATLAEASGCHVYLWVTHKFLPVGLALFEAWGVRYQCQLTWDKKGGMTPYSWMYDTEHILFGRIGHLDLLQYGLRLLFSEAARGHSIKPEIFYERVRQASPGPRLEMFARAANEGFHAWGAEAPRR